jgi:cytochrome c
MKTSSAVVLVSVCLVGGSAARAAMSAADATSLMAKYNCQACHTVDKRLVGPAFRDVAKKYAATAGAAASLAGKVKNGSTGTWGQIPMPPNNVPPADIDSLVQWILSLK